MLRVSRIRLFAVVVVTLGAVALSRCSLATTGFVGGLLFCAGSVIFARGFLVALQRFRLRERSPDPTLATLPDLPIAPSGDVGPSVCCTDFCQVHITPDGVVHIRDSQGQPLVGSIRYYTETDQYQLVGLTDIRYQCLANGDSTVVTLSGSSAGEEVTIAFRFAHRDATVQVSTCVVYHQTVQVRRSALFWDLKVPLQEVYRPSGACVRRDFASFYWLARQGALFGSGTRAVFLNHVPGVSSLQVDTVRSRLWVNLDSERDHPYVTLPYRQDGTAQWEDTSAALCQAGSHRRNSFTIWVGGAPAIRPRLSCHPHGFLASYVWTEHACNTVLETQRAISFGHSNLRDSSEACGGFVKHRVPLTKSVHYSNIHNADLRSQGSPWTRPMLSICSGDSQFLDFLSELHAEGLVEICLHCTDPHSSSRPKIEESLRFLRDRFRPVSWIDHIWCRPDGVCTGCRESFSCEAFRAGSPGFIADLLEQYGIQYFWNHAFEYMTSELPFVAPFQVSMKAALRTFAKHLTHFRFVAASEEFWDSFLRRYLARRRFAGRTDIGQSGNPVELYYDVSSLNHRSFYFKHLAARELGFPNPRYFQHPTRTGSAVHWPTFSCEPGPRPAHEWQDLFTEEELECFCMSGETYLAHAYPTWAGSANGCLVMEGASTCRISPDFDRILERMAWFRQAGKINLTTIQKLLDHWRALESVEFVYLPDGSVRIINHNDYSISGLTIACSSPHFVFDRDGITCKASVHGYLFSFDLPAHDSVVFSQTSSGFQSRQEPVLDKCA